MCGIAGVVSFNESGKRFLDFLQPATDALQRRGPDAGNIWRNNTTGLGHRRLSIIDTSEAANQPMQDTSGRYRIIFNGEIFNYRELKKELEQHGETFTTASDTEVLLRLFMREGNACLNKLNGFFAFAIHDSEDDKLFIARDRFGIKPLVFFADNDKFLFASELKSLFQFQVERKLDMASLALYFQLNYLPAPHCMLQGFRKLKPGYFIEISKSNWDEKNWYAIPYNEEKITGTRLSYISAQKKLTELMDDSVERRLIADVPLGAFLSGGIDSSIIVALASRHTQHLSTFSIGYKDEPFFDETYYAELVAEKYKTNHTVFSLKTDDLFNELNVVLDYFDEPFADSSALPVHILCRHTRKHATVALSGDGADELFGGYMKHVGENRIREGGFLLKSVSALAPLWDSLPQSRNNFFGNRIRQLSKLAHASKLSAAERYWMLAGISSVTEVEKLISAGSELSEIKNSFTPQMRDNGSMNEFLLADMNLVLQGDMLPKVDWMSMSNSLEVRVPFLDYRVVDFAFSLPADFKVKKNSRKKILQDAFRNYLPDELYNRPKHGFEVPLLKWMRDGLTPKLNELLNEDFVSSQKIFHYATIKNLLMQLKSGNPGDSAAKLWALLVFQHWWNKWFI